MKHKYLMESLENFLDESIQKPHNEITNEDRLNAILGEFGIRNPREVPNYLKGGIYGMAEEIYNQRGFKYIQSGWINSN